MQVESRGRCAKVTAPHASKPRSHRALYTPRAADEAAAIQALSRAYMESLDKVEVSTLVRAAWPKKADFVGSLAKIQRLVEAKVLLLIKTTSSTASSSTHYFTTFLNHVVRRVYVQEAPQETKHKKPRLSAVAAPSPAAAVAPSPAASATATSSAGPANDLAVQDAKFDFIQLAEDGIREARKAACHVPATVTAVSASPAANRVPAPAVATEVPAATTGVRGVSSPLPVAASAVAPSPPPALAVPVPAAASPTP